MHFPQSLTFAAVIGSVLIAGCNNLTVTPQSAPVADKVKGEATKVLDLGGKTLMPSFIDAHSHYINSLLVANQAKLYAPPAGPGKDVESIVAELKKFAKEHNVPKGEEIIGYGYDVTAMPNDRLLNRDDLDAAFPDNPVQVGHVSMHGAVMNSLALVRVSRLIFNSENCWPVFTGKDRFDSQG
jgi:predicted amidohydrolase YtcJ